MNQHLNSSGYTDPAFYEGDAAPLRRDAIENRERILGAARQLFAESGIEPVSMHRIAQVAGVGQATLYRHYTHKGDVCRDVIKESAERARTELEVYLRECADQPVLDRLDGVIGRYLSFVEEKLPYLAAIGDACAGEYRTTKFSQPAYRWMHGIIAELLESAQVEGAIPPVDVAFTADALLAALSPDMYQYQREERGLTREQIMQGVRRLYA